VIACAAGFVTIAFLACFLHLSYNDIQTWDEADNAGVILETIDEGNYFVLLRRGEPYFDKPPLWYYLTQAVVRIAGADEFTFRLISAVSGFLLIILVFSVSTRMFSPLAGFAAGLFMLAVRQLFIPRPGEIFSTHHIRSADSDVLLILLLFAAYCCFYRVSCGERNWLIGAAFLSALAVMTKGPLGLIAAVAFFLFLLLSARRISLSAREILYFLLVFAAVAVPWHLLMYAKFGPIFLDKYPRYIWFRVASGLPVHTPPWYYYFRILANRRVFFGCELLLLAVVATLLDRRRLSEYRYGGTLLAFFLFFGMLNITKTKIAWYLLPLYPFAAVLVAGLVERLRQLVIRPGLYPRWRVGAASLVAAIFTLTAAAAAHNLYSIVRFQPGPVQEFFRSARALCGDDLVYADERMSVYFAYQVRRHGLRTESPGDAGCFIAREDTMLPPRAEEIHRKRLMVAGFVLWEREADTDVPLR
jgi:4-amino-4-deoxy-L-arabinose transferase-like glycosyltransferase